ncbi:hypothetical protein SDC9_163552 [bioreactor metagenome]|uniref:Uncharacterized protein n=1 Tax=bioreactor metagenome TaxID=1076179 RepID=A0A645FW02_9ZZZZ
MLLPEYFFPFQQRQQGALRKIINPLAHLHKLFNEAAVWALFEDDQVELHIQILDDRLVVVEAFFRLRDQLGELWYAPLPRVVKGKLIGHALKRGSHLLGFHDLVYGKLAHDDALAGNDPHEPLRLQLYHAVAVGRAADVEFLEYLLLIDGVSRLQLAGIYLSFNIIVKFFSQRFIVEK